MLEFRSKDERSEMSATAQTMMRDYAGTRWPSLNHKGRMSRLAGVLGFGHRRVRSIYQNEPGLSLRADEMAAIAALREQKIEEANRNAFADLQGRIARLEAALFAQDEEFHQHQMAALRGATGVGRGNDVTSPAEREGGE